MKYFSLSNNIIYIFKKIKIWDKSIFFLLFLFGSTRALYPFIIPWFGKMTIEYITKDVEIIKYLALVICLVSVIIIIQILSSNIKLRLWWKFFYLKNKFVIEKLDKTMSISFEELEKPEIMDVMHKADQAVQGTNGVEGMLYSIQDMLIGIFKILISISIMTILSPLLVTVLILLSVVNYYYTTKTKEKDIELLWNIKAPIDRKVDYFSDISCDASYAKDIRLYNANEWLIKKLKHANNDAHNCVKNSKKNWMISSGISNLVSGIQQGCIYLWLIMMVMKGELGVDFFIFYIGCISVLFDSFGEFLDKIGTIKKQSKEVSQLRCFLEYNTGKRNNLKNISLSEIGEKFDLKFENVWFRYDENSEFVLKDINFTICSNQKLAVVGDNGAGKSTLIKLICRLYRPTNGRILLNGIDIELIDEKHYFELIAPIFQDVIIFALPLYQNVTLLQKTESDMNKIWKIMDEVGLKDKVAGLKNSIDSEMLKIMYQDGVELSGGEKQKISMARALYKDGRIVIMDEPTSALDPIAESEVYGRLNEITNRKMGIYISHRLSSTKFCDNIILLEMGKIIEMGNHAELLDVGNKYFELYNTQAQYYTRNG